MIDLHALGLLPAGRPRINLNLLLAMSDFRDKGCNKCVSLSLVEPRNKSRAALAKGLRRVLPFMYRAPQQALDILVRYGIDFADEIPLPSSFDFQWAHTGEFLVCAYFEECEGAVVLTYKWRLNTTKNQHQFGMDLIAFDLTMTPPRIYAIAVKTTEQGNDGKTPSVVYGAIHELNDYLSNEKLDDDLEIIAANMHTDDSYRKIFEDWYNPYSQGVPASKPALVVVPAFVVEGSNWRDRYARPAIGHDFGVPGAVRVFRIDRLGDLVRAVYSRGQQ
jgi:hypothetical protein